MTMTDITIEFSTDQPSQVDRVLFEAIQHGVHYGVLDSDLEILSALMIGAIRAGDSRWRDEDRQAADRRETETINMAVAAGLAKAEPGTDDRKRLGSIRADKIKEALDRK